MDVCVVGTRGFPDIEGGVERHCEALYGAMPDGVSVTVFRRRPYVSGGSPGCGVSFVDLPSTRIKGFETLLHSLLATVVALLRGPDVVHYHNIGPALFSPLLKVRGIPVVLTYHSPNYEHEKWGWAARRLLRLSERVALGVADRIIFVNRFQMAKYGADVAAKSTFIPNGVPPCPRTASTAKLDELGLEPGRYVLAVGRVTPEKGFDVLVEAFRRARLDGCRLAIVGGVEGEAAYGRRLAEAASGLPVVLAGQLHGDDLAQLYQNAGLFVLPSRNEGFPLVLLEAMAYGLDVLVSDMPATRLVDLEEGDYCEPGNAAGLSEALGRKAREGFRRRSYDLSCFDWRDIAKRTAAVYEDAAARGKGE